MQDSDLTPISMSHSIFNGVTGAVGTNILAAQEVASYFSGVPMVDNGLKDTLEMVERENQSPQQGIGQVSANTITEMVTSGIGTGYLGKLGMRGFNLVFGQVAKKALPDAITNFAKKPLSRVFGEDVAQYLPKAATEEGKKVMSVGEFGQHLTESYGGATGFMLPSAIVDNYNQDQNTLHWGGIAKESLGAGAALTLAIDVFPYTAGVLWGKTKGFLGDAKMPMPGSLTGHVPPEVLSGEESGAQHHPTLNKLWTAHQQGNISLGEYQWMRDYLVNPSNLNDMKNRAVSILMKDGHPVDAGQLNVMLQLMKPEDAQSFLTGVSDQLGSAVDKVADSDMSDYVVKNGLDRIQSDPKLLPGIKGFYEFISNKLENKPEHLGRFERMREEPQEHINNSHPFSQQNIYTAEKNGAESPHTVPENVSQRLKQEGRIAELKEKLQRFIGKAMPKELGEAKGAAEKEFTKADKDLTKAQGKLDRSIDAMGKHETKINELEDKIKSETKEEKLKDLNDKLEKAKAKRAEYEAANKKLSQQVKFAKAAHKNVIKKLKHIEGKIREHAEKLKAQGKSVQVFDRIKKIEEKLEKLRKNLSQILHPDDELREIEKSLIKEDGSLPKNFRSTNAYQRLHDLAQISDRAKMLLHHVELIREYEKQEGYKNVADLLIKLSENGFRKLSDGDRVVSYLKDRVEQSSGLKPKEEKVEPLKEEKEPVDAEKILEEQSVEQKSDSEIHKEAYDQAKAKFDEFKKSGNVFKNFIQCVTGTLNG